MADYSNRQQGPISFRSRWGPVGTVTLSWSANDPETLFLAKQIQEAFDAANSQTRQAQWILDAQPRIFSRAIYWGIKITGESTALVTAVRNAFSDAGIEYGTDAIPNILSDTPGMVVTPGAPPAALIWVGPKQPLQ